MTNRPSTLAALSLVLGSVDAVRHWRALYVLLATFCLSGLLMASTFSALGGGGVWRGALEAGAALFVAFYGGNAAGILVMDDLRGEPARDAYEALIAALGRAHRLLVILLAVLGVVGLVGGLLAGLLWLCRAEVLGRIAGPLLFGLVMPLGVVGVGGLALVLAAVVVPLAAPAIWAGAGLGLAFRQLAWLVRQRLLTVGLLVGAVSLLSAAVGAVVTFVVASGGRVVSELAVRVVGLDVPAQELMAGLFGYGLRSMGAAGAPAVSTGHVAAALVSGGIVFAIGLVLPGIVYLRGTCAVYLAMTEGANLPHLQTSHEP